MYIARLAAGVPPRPAGVGPLMALSNAYSDEVQDLVRNAAPPGWHIGPVTSTRYYLTRPGDPEVTYEAEASTGRPLGRRGLYEGSRRMDVTLSAASIDDLVAAIRTLPILAPLLDLPRDAKVDVRTWDD